MSTPSIRRMAEQSYESGRALFQSGQYREALVKLREAEDAFRKWDARGHPFADHLDNGMSGLANTLALSGRCHQKLGNFTAALACYETSLINSKFEKKSALKTFTQTITEDLIACYEHILTGSEVDRNRLLIQEPEVDISYRFPFSLPPESIPLARLYELAPDRYAHYKDFYDRAQTKTSVMARTSKTADESTMKRASIYVWGILAAIWIIYGLIVVNAFYHHR